MTVAAAASRKRVKSVKASLIAAPPRGGPPPRKRARTAAAPPPPPKRSNRPGYDHSASSDDEDEEDEVNEATLDAHPAADAEEDVEAQRAAMLAALAAHQASFLREALPTASTSSAPVAIAALTPGTTKSVWEMDDADWDDNGDGDEEEEDDEDDEEEDDAQEAGRERAADNGSIFRKNRQPAAVVAFVEPGRGDSPSTLAPPSVPLNKRELRDFKAGKVKNVHARPSIADQHNVKYVGGKAKKKQEAATAGKPLTQEEQRADAAEESHLSKLDSHLASLVQPLTSGTKTSLPDLLRELPLAPTQPLKGHTPLPKNAPRLLRKGQNAANLKRAQLRDAAAGHGQGARKAGGGQGREALTLKEKRRLEGTDTRQRGLGAKAGKWGRGQLSLSKKEIASINGPGS